MKAATKRAIVSGITPKPGRWRTKLFRNCTLGEKVCQFIECLAIPEGDRVGETFILEEFQVMFILAIFHGTIDNPKRASRAILSIGRKGGKTALIAALLIAIMFIPDIVPARSRVNSAALSRDQAALIFNYMQKILQTTYWMQDSYHIIPSGKRVVALKTGVEYQALAAEASKAMGLSPAVLVGDEWGQITADSHPYVDALLSSQGAHLNPLAVIISTQAPGDSALLSRMIDDAKAHPSDDVVCHVYAAPDKCELNDRRAWYQACPALGRFRSEDDIRRQADEAARLPTREAAFRNLILNQRISQERLWLAPEIWKRNQAEPVLEVFRNYPVAMGLDLSARNDLTAAVLAAQDDDGEVHLLPFVFCPTDGIADRSRRDRAPYDVWVREGHMVPIGGQSMDYEQIAEYLRTTLDDLGIVITSVEFDRWRIDVFKRYAEEAGLAPFAEWHSVGQGYKDFSPRCEAFMAKMLEGQIRHGDHPLLNMSASHAIALTDPAGSVKLDKSKSNLRIDPLIAAVMAVYPVTEGETAAEFDPAAMIG